MDTATKISRFAGLDGLRGIAALAVLGIHVPDPATYSLLSSSYLAVDLFFIISGFVLSHAYDHRLVAGLSVIDFMRMRVLRLYPLYILGTMITAGLVVVQLFRWRSFDPTTFTGTLLTAVLFMPTPPRVSLNSYFLYPLNAPAWSLFFELLINLVFAMLAPRLNRRVLAVVLALGLGGLTIALLAAGSVKDVGFGYQHGLGGLGRVTWSFFLGIALYRIWHTRQAEWFRLPPWVPIIALVCLFAMRGAGTERLIIDFVSCLVLLPLIVFASANAAPSGAFARFCMFVGAVSYPIYVLQMPIIDAINAVSNFLTDVDMKDVGVGGSFLIAAILFPAAYIANEFYDTRIRRWLTTRTAGGRPAEGAARKLA
jgi:peptidoglycan/LPS O-acetylase OafA/YrhL